MSRKRAIVVCPGRGTYNAAELGYLTRYHGDKNAFISEMDAVRAVAGQVPISELDGAARFSPSKHGSGDNASLLIYTCAMADYQSINNDLYDIVGVTGNSMGWYLSLAAGGAASMDNGAQIVNTMGGIMTAHGQGGQVVFSLMNENWTVDPEKKRALDRVLSAARNQSDVSVSVSIYLGGMVVLAADDAGLSFLLEQLPKDDRFPFQIRGHSAFHSNLLDHCVPLAQQALNQNLIITPDIPMIDGLGNVWMPYTTDPEALYRYTFRRQINATYDFSRAIEVAAKEFAPDVFIVLGPGTTMGAPVAQTLIDIGWRNLAGKDSFKQQQAVNPVVLSMGIEEQRDLVIKG